MAKQKAMSTDAPRVAADPELEQKKAAGQTDSQQAIREYHETTFQTQDPITGEDRDDVDFVRPFRLDRGESLP